MIRPITNEDIPQLKLLLDAAYTAHAYPIGGGWTEALLRDALKEGHGLILVPDGEIAGAVQAFLIYRVLDDVVDVTVLATAPTFQRQGGMSTLLRELLKDPRYRRVWLEVHEGNTAAVGLYERLGFSFQGRRPGYYRDGGTALLYSLEKQLLK